MADNNNPRVLQMEVTDSQMQAIKEEVRREMEVDFTREKLMSYIRQDMWVSAIDILKEFGIYGRYEQLKDKAIKDLTDHEKMIVQCYWALYESFGR